MRIIAMICAVGTLGCSGIISSLDTKPARLDVLFPNTPIWDKQIHPLPTRVLNQEGRDLPEETSKLSWSSVPMGIIDVSANGVKCLSSGDASVVVSGSGVSQTFSIQCRIVATLKVSKHIDLLLGEPDALYSVAAFDSVGKILSDAVVQVESSNSSVVGVTSNRMTAHSVGTATITARSGDVIEKTSVTVIERIKTETLALSDGQTIAYTLPRGRYKVSIQTRASDGSYYGVSVTSTSTGCPTRSEARNHEFNCEVSDTTSLVISNPTTFGFGPPQMGNITIYKTP